MAVFLIFEEIERKVETKTILLSALTNLLCACFVRGEVLFVLYLLSLPSVCLGSVN